MIDDMKKILLFALPLMVMCFASCEKDNGNDGNSVQKLVKSINSAIPDYPLVISFEYDENGRVVHIEWTGEGHSFADVVYENGMITETGSPGYISIETPDGPPVTQTKAESIHYLNDDGYVIKTIHNDYYSDEKYNSTSEVTYEYENGKLISIAGADGDRPVKQTFQWQGNDITAVTVNDYTNEITYSDIKDNFNVDLVGMIMDGDAVGSISTAQIKFKGTTSEHLPQMMYDEEIYSYELDSDGFVTTIKEDGEPIYYIEYIE